MREDNKSTYSDDQTYDRTHLVIGTEIHMEDIQISH